MQIPKRKAGQFKDSRLDYRISQARFDKLSAELAKLKKSQPKRILEVQQLAEMGDFSENAGYQIAKGRLRGINQRILEIEDILKHAQIIKESSDKSQVSLGATVELESKGKKFTFKILGPSEANPSANIISQESPLGAALMNKCLGEEVEVNGNVYRILKIK